MDCLFCNIVSGNIPGYKIYEDDIVIVILDINPQTDGHSLIIPKRHYQNLIDIPTDTLSHINDVAKKMYILLEQKLNIKGASIINNIGDAQEIKHFHMHIVPTNNKKQLKNVEELYKKIQMNK